MRVLIALVLFALALHALADVKAKIAGPENLADVKAKIAGPEKSSTQEILELTAEIEGDTSDFRLRPRPKDLRERFTEDGHKCYLWIPESGVTYMAELLVVGVVDGKAKIATAYKEIQPEDDPTPPPPPGPAPPSPPSPPTPPTPNPPAPPGPNPPSPGPEDGRFGVAVLAYNAAKQVNRPAEANLLAGAFRETGHSVRTEQNGVFVTLNKLRKATAVVPETSKSYWQACNDLLSAKLKAHYSAGKLASPNDWADCFEEVARGLEAAAK